MSLDIFTLCTKQNSTSWLTKKKSRSGSECILAWRSWRIHASISSTRGHLAPSINGESDIVREKLRGKQTRTRLGTRPPAYYDVTGTYRYIPPGHTNKCSLRDFSQTKICVSVIYSHQFSINICKIISYEASCFQWNVQFNILQSVLFCWISTKIHSVKSIKTQSTFYIPEGLSSRCFHLTSILAVDITWWWPRNRGAWRFLMASSVSL